ncbi:MAG: DUF1134 domain-containing protein [Erythrobacter sp.]
MSKMIARFTDVRRHLGALMLAGLATLALAEPAAAQDMETFDPDAAFSQSNGAEAIDADLAAPQAGSGTAPATAAAPAAMPNATVDNTFGDFAAPAASDAPLPVEQAPMPAMAAAATPAAAGQTYGEDDLIGAAEGVFGKGAEGLAKLIEDLLKKQGEPNGYIVGREAGGAFIFGARYGSGTLHHKVEGEQKVYWTGPSVGFDAGANAANTFVLVYNLYDSEDLFKRYPAGEGQAYLVGGLNASYLRRGNVVLIPIRVGAGLRLGINAGYMKFSKQQRWLPF